MAKKGSKYYVVWIGKSPGIYETWKECQVQISGYPSAKYKSFPTKEAATEAFRSSYDQYYSFGPKKEINQNNSTEPPTRMTINPKASTYLGITSLAIVKVTP